MNEGARFRCREGGGGGFMESRPHVSRGSRDAHCLAGLGGEVGGAPWIVIRGPASERRGNILNDFKDQYLTAKARIWP